MYVVVYFVRDVFRVPLCSSFVSSSCMSFVRSFFRASVIYLFRSLFRHFFLYVCSSLCRDVFISLVLSFTMYLLLF